MGYNNVLSRLINFYVGCEMIKNFYSRIKSSLLKISYISERWVYVAIISSAEVLSLHIHDK